MNHSLTGQQQTVSSPFVAGQQKIQCILDYSMTTTAVAASSVSQSVKLFTTDFLLTRKGQQTNTESWTWTDSCRAVEKKEKSFYFSYCSIMRGNDPCWLALWRCQIGFSSSPYS